MEVKFVVPGKPKGKGRPRMVYTKDKETKTYQAPAVSGRISAKDFLAMQNGGKVKQKGHAYTPQDTADYENLVKTIYLTKVKYRFPDETPLHINIAAYFEIPKSASKAKREKLLQQKSVMTKPDGDNILKIICDGLNDVAFSDDKVLADKRVYKCYADEPRVEVTLSDRQLNFTLEELPEELKKQVEDFLNGKKD